MSGQRRDSFVLSARSAVTRLPRRSASIDSISINIAPPVWRRAAHDAPCRRRVTLSRFIVPRDVIQPDAAALNLRAEAQQMYAPRRPPARPPRVVRAVIARPGVPLPRHCEPDCLIKGGEYPNGALPRNKVKPQGVFPLGGCSRVCVWGGGVVFLCR